MFDTRIIDTASIKEMNCIKDLLNSQGLYLPAGAQYVIAVYNGSRLVGTGALVGKILQGIAVDSEFQGEGISAIIVTDLVNKALEIGRNHLFIFTKPKSSSLFQALGFKPVAASKPDVVLLEWGTQSIEKFKSGLRQISRDKPEASCIVVNCNPFSLGHKYIIEKASYESRWLYVIVVQEDKSLFPYEARIKLVAKGIGHLENVTVIPGGDYIISAATFPSYFTREADLARVHASLDIEVFTTHIAPALKINRRYVGEEPYCEVTNLYNMVMKNRLPKKGIQLIEVPRVENNGRPISASFIREKIKAGEIDHITELVPKSTLSYLKSSQAREVIERIVNSSSRH